MQYKMLLKQSSSVIHKSYYHKLIRYVLVINKCIIYFIYYLFCVMLFYFILFDVPGNISPQIKCDLLVVLNRVWVRGKFSLRSSPSRITKLLSEHDWVLYACLCPFTPFFQSFLSPHLATLNVNKSPCHDQQWERIIKQSFRQV